MNVWEFIEKGYGYGDLESLRLYIKVDGGVTYRVTHLRHEVISLLNESNGYCQLRKIAQLGVTRVSRTRISFHEFRTTLHIDHIRKP